jgi:hypothetical protein
MEAYNINLLLEGNVSVPEIYEAFAEALEMSRVQALQELARRTSEAGQDHGRKLFLVDAFIATFLATKPSGRGSPVVQSHVVVSDAEGGGTAVRCTLRVVPLSHDHVLKMWTAFSSLNGTTVQEASDISDLYVLTAWAETVSPYYTKPNKAPKGTRSAKRAPQTSCALH